jgi:hypothetical protein
MLAKSDEVKLHAQYIQRGLDNILIMSEALRNSLMVANAIGLGEQSSQILNGMECTETLGVTHVVVKIKCAE